jgi:hypothetical protein
MKLLAVLACAAVFAALPLRAAMDGKVVNGTSGQPQAGVIVSLMQPGQGGMQTLSTVKTGADGAFHFDAQPAGMHVIQAIYRGVVYTEAVPPGSPSSNLTVNVYEATTKRDSAKLNEHLVVLQPGPQQMAVSEDLLFTNPTKVTFNDPVNGSAKVWIPDGGRGGVTCTVTSPGGVPIQRDLVKTKEPGVYVIDYPLKPGETRFEISYNLPSAQPQIFESRVLDKLMPMRLVVPPGVTLTGDNIQPMGQEPTTQATIYNVATDRFQVQVEGMVAATSASGGEDAGVPQIHEGPPPVYARMWWIFGLSLFILTLGAALLYRRGDPAEKR